MFFPQNLKKLCLFPPVSNWKKESPVIMTYNFPYVSAASLISVLCESMNGIFGHTELVML